MARLSEAEVDRALAPLKGWTRQADFIEKEFRFRTFLSGIRFVDAVAKIAESQEHHPDIHIVWTTVTLKIQTPDEGGITKWDIGLAKEIEKYWESSNKRPQNRRLSPV
jgi:4a-hydroxytetrahydrobiopterin dehydratase